MHSYGSFGSVVHLPSIGIAAFAAQCAGIIGLRRAGKNAAWWTMHTGLILHIVGILASYIGIFAIGRTAHALPVLMIIGGSLPLLSSLIFAIGFAIHGSRAARAADRLAELENFATAMSEEINRLRQGGPAK
jgi:hypothetical protein